MSNSTFISREPIIVDVPDVSSLSAKFVYRKFKRDERTAEPVNVIGETGEIVSFTRENGEEVELKSGEMPDDLQKDFGLIPTPGEKPNLVKEVPRLVQFTFPQPQGVRFGVNLTSIKERYNLETIMKDHPGVVQSEGSVTTFSYKSMTLQDTSLAARIKELIRFTSIMRFPASHPAVNGSQVDFAQALDAITPSTVTSKEIGEAVVNLIKSNPVEESQTLYVNELTTSTESDYLANQMSESFHIQIHKNFEASILRSMEVTPFSPFKKGLYYADGDDISTPIAFSETGLNKVSKINAAISSQSDSRLQIGSEFDLMKDYEPFVIMAENPEGPLPQDAEDASKGIKTVADLPPAIELMGYIIDKYEIQPGGGRIKKDPIVVNIDTKDSQAQDDVLPTASSIHAFDLGIKYGTLYAYSVSSVYQVQKEHAIAQSVDSPTGGLPPGVYLVNYVIKSKPSPEVTVKCDEKRPPQPPGHLMFDYLYDRDALMITWTLSPDSQDDVKRFQVFRRASVLEPFTAIKEYIFDDSDIVLPPREQILPKNKRFVSWNSNGEKNPHNWCVDEDFGRKSDYIYSVCCVDAHGHTSFYSTQLRVKFNRDTNRLDVESISREGAPKQYPNFYINPTRVEGYSSTRITEEVMRDGNHSSMRIYFDPEYLSVTTHETDDNGEMSTKDVGLIKAFKHFGPTQMAHAPKYKFYILNVDRQRSQTVDIVIRDPAKLTEAPID